MQEIEVLPLGIAVLDRDGHVLRANRSVCEWFRLLPRDVEDRSGIGGCVACGDQCCNLCAEVRRKLAAGADVCGLRAPANGNVILEARCAQLPGEDCHLLIVESRSARAVASGGDDSDQEMASLLAERSRELTYSREFLRSLIETNRDLVLSVDVGGDVTFTNSGFIGAPAAALIGNPLTALVESGFRIGFSALCDTVLGGRSPHVLYEAQGAGPLQDRWCLFSVGPVRGGEKISGMTVIVSDLTLMKEAREKVRGGEKLIATARMAARIAHEINNPLTGISGAIQLIKADLQPGEPAFRYAEMVDREIARVSNIVRQMYGLYRPEQEPSQAIDLHPVLDEIVTLMLPDAGCKRVRLLSHVSTPEFALVQEQNLRQILMNIVRNAIEVTAADGLVEIAVERRGRCVDVVVSDQGPGITEELRQQMFEPFYTTKSTSGGRGLGLGLSVSDTLVRAIGGSIEFENREAGGARCRICLPESGVEPAGA